MENCTIFLEGLRTRRDGAENVINKADIHEFFATQEGLKTVYFSGHSAHIVLPNRQSALLLYKTLAEDTERSGVLAKQFVKTFGENSGVRLINEAESTEIIAENIDNVQALNRLKADNYVTDNKMIKQLMDILLKAKSYVLLEFIQRGDEFNVEIFVGVHPVLKIQFNPESLDHGLGDLIASSSIVKIISRLDTDTVYQALRMSSSSGFKPANFFDLGSANNAIEYVVMGQSMFMVPQLPTKLFASRLGVITPTKMEDYLYTYLHLVNHLLPQSVINMLSTKTEIMTNIGTNISIPESKEKKTKLRKMYESYCVHIHVTCDTLITDMKRNGNYAGILLKSFLEFMLEKHNLKYERIDIFKTSHIVKNGGVAGIVQLCYPEEINTFTATLNQYQISSKEIETIKKKNELTLYNLDAQHFLKEMCIFASSIDLKVPNRIDSESIEMANLKKLESVLNLHLQSLEELGFFNLLNKYNVVNDGVDY